MTSKKIIKKPPVVVILGHIDHGKTSLLMAIKNFGTLEKEVGGITQHIGAYQIEYQQKSITFIDTPGHEAFSAMRARGAKVADIAVLVVAADEGVKPQTKEAVSVAKEAKIPIVVAINKIDKPNADPERVKTELAKIGVLVEGRGGDVPFVNVSAKTGKGISDLLDLIVLVAEINDLKAEIEAPPEGVVIESSLDSKRGPLATVIVSKGVLKTGDIIATPSVLAKIRSLENFLGERIREALPSTPVLVLGFKSVPYLGERFFFFKSIEKAEEFIQNQKEKQKKDFPFFPKSGGKKILKIILKTDVLGLIETIEEVLKTIPQQEVAVSLIKKEVGDICLSDIELGETAKALIVGFRVKIPSSIFNLASKKKIKVMIFETIYDLVEGIRNYLQRIVQPETVRYDLGKLKVLVVFKTEKRRQIIGGRIIEGEVKRGKQIEVLREGEVVGKGKIINLQRNKRDIERGIRGEEVGILFEGDCRIEKGDVLVVFEKKREKPVI